MSDKAIHFDSAMIVLGMHRSGTSALTKVLSLLGCDLPQNLREASAINERGFWESTKVNEYNDEALKHLGENWFSFGPTAALLATDPDYALMVRRTADLIADEFAGAHLPVVKDPRICRLTPLWAEAFSAKADTLLFPFIVRNPLEVARSLSTRNGFDSELGLFLWARYNLDAEFHSRGFRRAFVSYDGLVDNWRGTLDSLSQQLNYQFTIDEAAAGEIGAFLTSDLRHQKVENDRIAEELHNSPLLLDTYRILFEWAHGSPASVDDLAKLDRARESLDRMGLLLSASFEKMRLDRKRIASAKDQAAEAESELKTALTALTDFSELQRLAAEQSDALSIIRELIDDEISASQAGFTQLSTELGLEREALKDQIVNLAQKIHDQQYTENLQKLEHDQAKILSKLRREHQQTREALSSLTATHAEGVSQIGAGIASLGEQARLEQQQTREALSSFAAIHSEGIGQIGVGIASLGEQTRLEQQQTRDELSRLAVTHAEGVSQIGAGITSLGDELRERVVLETALASAIEGQSELRGRLIKTEQQAAGGVAQLAQTIEDHKRELQVQREAADAELATERQASREAASSNKQKIEALTHSHEATSDELARVKHKYRSAQAAHAKLRWEHIAQGKKLIAAEAVADHFHKSIPWIFYENLRTTGKQVTRLARRLANPRSSRGQNTQLQQSLEIVRATALFDGEWYLSVNPDVAEAGTDPARHYIEHGWREGRNPGPDFDTTDYLRNHADVAGADVNPLIHFLEYGQFEGRAVSAHVSVTEPALYPAQDMAEAAPCISFAISPSVETVWIHHDQLTSLAGDLFTVGGIAVGIHAAEYPVPGLAKTVERFIRLSGSETETGSAWIENDEAQTPVCYSMVDCWFVDGKRLRTRWDIEPGSAGFVIRAIQPDRTDRHGFSFIGEACISDPLDLADFKLVNPFFPVLFFFTNPAGMIIGARILAFPSLCRGGIHYSELTHLTAEDGLDGEPFNVFRQSDRLANALLLTIEDKASTLVSTIKLDLNGAKGTEVMLTPAFRIWLRQILRINVEHGALPDDMPDEIRTHFIKNIDATNEGLPAVRQEAQHRELTLACDMIPSISILAALESTQDIDDQSNSRLLPLTMLVAQRDPSLPILYLSLPDPNGLEPLRTAPGYPVPFPSLVPNVSVPTPLCAIRIMPGTELSDAERLFPMAPPTFPVTDLNHTHSLTIFVYPNEWDQTALRLSLETLLLQDGFMDIRLALIGTPTDTVSEMIADLFPSGVEHYEAQEKATHGIDTELAAYIGPGILLHDNRTLRCLADMALNAAVESASCVLVSSEKRGKSWVVTVADSGETPLIFAANNLRPAKESIADPLLFWRSTYPVARPPEALWMCRSSQLREWEETNSSKGFHLCTSMVTATLSPSSACNEAPFVPPRAADAKTLRKGHLQG